ncbi:MAG: hypothetical protein WCL38_05040 [Actinomycetota bacterium]
MTRALGYWNSPWPAEDGGPTRQQRVAGHHGLAPGPYERFEVVHRLNIATTMVVRKDQGELFLLSHDVGGDAPCHVEQIDPITLETLARSADLPGGPIWPGGLAVHRNGDLYVVFGNHAHRLNPSLERVASITLPRHAPYNSFVILDSGYLATKDFGGRLPDGREFSDSTELLILDPETLAICASIDIDQGSIARLSAEGEQIVLVGVDEVFTFAFNADDQTIEETSRTRYRTLDGQTYGWDPVLVGNCAWFLDNGEGSEAFDGSFRGKGISQAPLHLVRVDLSTHEVQLTEIAGLPNGLIANPPIIDPVRMIAVGYDSSNSVLTGFHLDEEGVTSVAWSRQQDHASHLVLLDEPGQLVTFDFETGGTDDLVVLDITTGEELARVSTESPVQSVLFPTPGENRDLYYCSLTSISRVAVVHV